MHAAYAVYAGERLAGAAVALFGPPAERERRCPVAATGRPGPGYAAKRAPGGPGHPADPGTRRTRAPGGPGHPADPGTR
ncbi:hypothetical protein ABZ584_36010, partial [Streptomyces antibioticus]